MAGTEIRLLWVLVNDAMVQHQTEGVDRAVGAPAVSRAAAAEAGIAFDRYTTR
jgi:hypothetical protein